MSKYQIDPAHSKAGFTVKHMMISKVHGQFEKMSGELDYDSVNPMGASVDIKIEAASIITGETQRDSHLKSPDFFNVEKYPHLTFKSTKIERAGEGLKVVGDLTICGTTKSVTLHVEGPSSEIKDPWGKIKLGASATAKISRKDFGLNWNTALENGGVLVDDEVIIILDVQFLKQV